MSIRKCDNTESRRDTVCAKSFAVSGVILGYGWMLITLIAMIGGSVA